MTNKSGERKMMSEIRNSMIKSVSINNEDGRGLFAVVQFEGGGVGTVTYQPAKGPFVEKMLALMGKAHFERLAGLPCRVEFEGNMLSRIGHFMDDKWIDIRKDLA